MLCVARCVLFLFLGFCSHLEAVGVVVVARGLVFRRGKGVGEGGGEGAGRREGRREEGREGRKGGAG